MEDDTKPSALESVGRKPGTFAAGFDERRNPGGRVPLKVKEAQKGIDRCRNAEDVAEVINCLRDMARDPNEKGAVRVAAAEAWLNRIVGPAKPLIDEEDLRNAPPEVLRWLSQGN